MLDFILDFRADFLTIIIFLLYETLRGWRGVEFSWIALSLIFFASVFFSSLYNLITPPFDVVSFVVSEFVADVTLLDGV